MTGRLWTRACDTVAPVIFYVWWMTWLASSQVLILTGAIPFCGNHDGLGIKAALLGTANAVTFAASAWYASFRARRETGHSKESLWATVAVVAYLAGIAVAAAIPFQVILAFAATDRALVAFTYSVVFQPLLQGGLVIYGVRRGYWPGRKRVMFLAGCCIAIPSLWPALAVTASHVGCR